MSSSATSGTSPWGPTANGNRYSSLQDTFAVVEVETGEPGDQQQQQQQQQQQRQAGQGEQEKQGGQRSARVFQSTHPAFAPGGFTRAFGGHVYGQAAVAAGRTVPAGFAVHSITGHFLVLGRTDVPFTYRVSSVRDGASYAQRRVNVTQAPSTKLIFTAVVSFKTSEPSLVTSIRQDRLLERYGAVIAGRAPESWPEAPSVDSPFWYGVEEENGPDPFPGLEMRKVDMSEYNRTQRALDRMQLQYYRAIMPVPLVTEDPALHACAHLYASDRNGLFAIPNFLGEGDAYSSIASLSHTVIFHDEAATYSLLDADSGAPKWFCIEAAIEHIAHGRTLVSGKLWDVAARRPVASYVQDGLVRMKPNVVQSADGERIMFAPEAEAEDGAGAGTKTAGSNGGASPFRRSGKL